MNIQDLNILYPTALAQDIIRQTSCRQLNGSGDARVSWNALSFVDFCVAVSITLGFRQSQSRASNCCDNLVPE